MKNESESESLSHPSVHGILQARILEWIAIPFSRGSSWPRDRTQVSCMAGRFFTIILGNIKCKESLPIIFLSNVKKNNFIIQSSHACMLSCFSHVWLFATPWTIAHQAPLSMEFSPESHGGLLCSPHPGTVSYIYLQWQAGSSATLEAQISHSHITNDQLNCKFYSLIITRAI